MKQTIATLSLSLFLAAGALAGTHAAAAKAKPVLQAQTSRTAVTPVAKKKHKKSHKSHSVKK
ncbi:MAG: hypothetical protein HYR56_13700 [Acidobacteria bacterium]|nr:hypothetical protein [Acidobacteriota bacterium]MBI3422620.1 hypothetical protein [Acidobacteriota bacterium]